MQRIFIKNCFLFTAASVCRVKQFTTGSRKSQGRSKVADDARLTAEVTETTVKRLLCCRFRRTGKAMGQVHQCWWRICEEMFFFFFSFECHMFYILHQFMTYLLTLPRITLRHSMLNISVDLSASLHNQRLNYPLSTFTI
jgi:hypothetical protein